MEWRASHILLKSSSQAREVHRRLIGGADFKVVARELSQCPSKTKGGDLGWFGSGKMVPEFERECARLGVGRISGIVKTQFGFHIIKLTGRR